MSQFTYLIANTCFTAAQGKNWLHLFKNNSAFNDIEFKSAHNNPATLADAIEQMDEMQRDLLEEMLGAA